MGKLAGVLLAVCALPVAAQWLNYPESRTPRTKDGKPDMSAPAPRMDGKPDLSGVWQAEKTPDSEFERVYGKDAKKLQIDLGDVTKEGLNLFWGMKPEEQPIRPEAEEIRNQNAKAGPVGARCLPAGLPLSIFVLAFKVVQSPREIVTLFESGDPARQIYLDGRGLPEDPQPAWMGYSVGKWDGDTLVVETAGFNEMSPLDGAGHPRSDSMHLRERYHRRDFGHMDLEITVEDPKYYTRPFGLKAQLNLIPDSDVLEFVCAENEKDRAHVAR